MVFRVRELLIRQRTQAINALRGHLTEFGQIVPQGAANAARLIAIVEDPDGALPADAVPTLKALIAALTHLEAEIRKLDAEITRRAKENDVARRLMTVPGIGPLIATAIAVLAPPPETFRKARDFAAWLGLVPRQHSTGGRCLIPRFDGAILSQEWKEALWARFVTEAPRPRTPSELQYNDRKLRSRR